MSDYTNGSNVLLYIDTEALGHCTTTSLTCSSETKDIKVKAPASETAQGIALWGDKSVSGLSISMTGEGYIDNEEEEAGYEKLAAAWKAGKPIKAKYMRRGSTSPFLVCSFVITSLERNDPAQEESTYSISLENAGSPETFAPEALKALTQS